MPTVNDVAAYILQKQGEMTTMKLQKLVYYAQAWSLVWDDAPLFDERIEAWVNGPVVPELFHKYKKQYRISKCDGKPNALTRVQKNTVDAVLETYGDKTSQWLSELSHLEEPWREARRGLAPGERGDSEITLESMLNYYSRISMS